MTSKAYARACALSRPAPLFFVQIQRENQGVFRARHKVARIRTTTETARDVQSSLSVSSRLGTALHVAKVSLCQPPAIFLGFFASCGSASRSAFCLDGTKVGPESSPASTLSPQHAADELRRPRGDTQAPSSSGNATGERRRRRGRVAAVGRRRGDSATRDRARCARRAIVGGRARALSLEGARRDRSGVLPALRLDASLQDARRTVSTLLGSAATLGGAR